MIIVTIINLVLRLLLDNHRAHGDIAQKKKCQSYCGLMEEVLLDRKEWMVVGKAGRDL